MSNIAPNVESIQPLPTAPEQNVLTAAKGGVILFVGNAFSFAGRFMLGILLARLLNADQFGLYNLSESAIVIFAGLASFGMGLAMVRYVALFHSRRDSKGLWGTLQIGLGLPAILSLPVSIALFALATPIAEGLFHEPRLAPLLKLSSIAVPFFALSNIMAAATQGFKKMQYTIIAQHISYSIIKLILIGVLAITGLSVARAVGAHVVTIVIVCVMLLYFLNRLFSLKRPLSMGRRDIKGLINFALPVYLSNLIFTFRSNLQLLLLGTMQSVTSVGIFAVADRVTTVSTMVNNSMFVTSLPIVSELADRESKVQLGSFYKTMTKWIFALNLPLFLIIVIFANPILSIFGEDYVDGVTVLAILAGARLVDAGLGMAGALVDMTGHTRIKMGNSIVATSLMFGLSFLLIPSWGMVGAASVVLAETTIVGLACVTEVFILLRLLPYDANFVKPVIAGVMAASAALAMNKFLPAEASLASLVIDAAMLSVVYAGAILLLGLSQEDRLVLALLRERVGSKLSRRQPRPSGESRREAESL